MAYNKVKDIPFVFLKGGKFIVILHRVLHDSYRLMCGTELVHLSHALIWITYRRENNNFFTYCFLPEIHTAGISFKGAFS